MIPVFDPHGVDLRPPPPVPAAEPPPDRPPPVRLLFSTGLPVPDRVLAGVVGLTEQFLPGRVLAHYLFGSYANGTAIPASDLDVFAILHPDAGPDDIRAVRALYRYCDGISPIAVNPIPITPRDAIRCGFVEWVRGGKLLYGTDVAAGWPDPPPDRRTAHSLAITFGYACRLCRVRPPVPVPVPVPIPGDPFLGLVGGKVRYPDGMDRPGLMRLCGVVLTMARDLVLLRTGREVLGKGAVVGAYREAVGGPTADVVEAVYRRCREDWGFLLPEGAADRAELARLCPPVLGLVNDFVAEYRDFLRRHVTSADGGLARFAAARLDELIDADGVSVG